MNRQNARNLLLFLLPALLATIVFWPVHGFELVWDDTTWPEQVMRINSDFAGWLQHAFSNRTLGAYYRPLALSSFYFPPGTSAPASLWHLTSYCLYLANLVILGVIFYCLQQKAALAAPARVTTGMFSGVCLLLFMALHPTQVETAAWVSCRFDLMSSLFLLLIILAGLVDMSRTLRYGLQAALFFLALLSKETAIVFLGIYPVLMYILGNDGNTGFLAALKQQSVTLGLMLAASACYAVLWYHNGYFAGFSQRLVLNPLYTDTGSHLALILASLGYSLRLLAYPFIHLSPVHHHEGNISLANPHVWLGIAVIAFACHALLTRKKYLPVIAVILMGIFPFLNWKQLSFMGDLFQNRYLYLPILTGGIGLYGYLLKNPLPEHLSRYRAVIPLYLAGMGFVCISILPLWKNNLSLWSWVVAENPRSVEARNNLANELLFYNRIDAAMQQVEASLAIRSNFPAYHNLAQITWNQGDHESGNRYAALAMQYDAYQSDQLKLILEMTQRNLLAGNPGKARWWLNSIPAELFDNPLFKEEYDSLQARLQAETISQP